MIGGVQCSGSCAASSSTYPWLVAPGKTLRPSVPLVALLRLHDIIHAAGFALDPFFLFASLVFIEPVVSNIKETYSISYQQPYYLAYSHIRTYNLVPSSFPFQNLVVVRPTPQKQGRQQPVLYPFCLSNNIINPCTVHTTDASFLFRSSFTAIPPWFIPTNPVRATPVGRLPVPSHTPLSMR